jgi:hypothetical protein
MFRDHNERPIIVIDLMGLLTLVFNNFAEMLCGGRHDQYRRFYEQLFADLSACAEIVFFEGKLLLSHSYHSLTYFIT